MKIFIITMDDPIETRSFINTIIDARKNDIVGVAVSKGNRLKIGGKKSKINYLMALWLIMGPIYFSENVGKSICDRLRQYLSKWRLVKNPSILAYAESLSIPTFKITTPNNPDFINSVLKLKPDVIINQSQNILKKDILSVPRIGVINRHNALLPRNRGRLSPFWVLYNGEKETGVSIHFVEESLDSGDIIVQKRIPVDKNESFRSLVKKNYTVAPIAMLEALDVLETGSTSYLPNDEEKATYNTIPTLRDAIEFKKRRRQ